MKKPLFDRYERMHIVNYINKKQPYNSNIILAYCIYKNKQEVLKKTIRPIFEPVIIFLNKIMKTKINILAIITFCMIVVCSIAWGISIYKFIKCVL